ncbi:MAG: glutamate racemase [Erysipelotrichia bacterium]|nr:glutamate racemase [Erysipelotrichia bacterium]NCC55277.1 glutamate racemase [Erysipelotrichia bacterium]
MSANEQPIGVFDSGLGGISVLKELRKHMPNEHFIYYGDSAYAPYGTKDKQYIIDRCIHICDFFMQHKVKAIVIACNTATSVAAPIVRERYNIPIIGMEPALKVAAHNKCNQNIIVMATPLTLKEKKFEDLMAHYSNDHHIVKMPCPELVKIVENDELGDKEKVINQLYSYYRDVNLKAIDSIVLGCTHFVFYRPFFDEHFKNISIIDGNLGTSNHLQHILEERNLVNTHKGSVSIFNSSTDEKYISLSYKLLEKEI